MKALLVRIGIDTEYGRWNSPMDSMTGEFVYVPIPENERSFRGLERPFKEIIPTLAKFASERNKDLYSDLKFPTNLETKNMHLDPDFDYLTYGDADTRGSRIAKLSGGDILAVYGGLRPIDMPNHGLVYALVGIFVVQQITTADKVSTTKRKENAHTRRLQPEQSDVIVKGQPDLSGRLKICIPIGEWRNKAYRVRKDILRSWGGLSVKDGFIQRSAVPPFFLNPEKFNDWLSAQRPVLIARNNYE